MINNKIMKQLVSILFLLMSFSVHAQTVVKGRVVDQQNVAVIGANVYIDGSYDGSVTDENGDFQFKTSETGVRTLVISYLSYDTFKKTGDVSALSDLTVKLKESVTSLRRCRHHGQELLKLATKHEYLSLNHSTLSLPQVQQAISSEL
jgi:hypothetical protein